MIIASDDNQQYVPRDIFTKVAQTFLEAASLIEEASFASSGIDPRDDASFRLPDGRIMRRLEHKHDIPHRTANREFRLNGGDFPIYLSIHDCSRSPTYFSTLEAKRSIAAAAKTLGQVVDYLYDPKGPTLETAKLAARCILVREDLKKQSEDAKFGITPPTRRPGLIAFATPWSKAKIKPYACTTPIRCPEISYLPQIIQMCNSAKGNKNAPTSVNITLTPLEFEEDTLAYDPMARLRIENALQAITPIEMRL